MWEWAKEHYILAFILAVIAIETIGTIINNMVILRGMKYGNSNAKTRAERPIKQTICNKCLGCNRLEIQEFEGVKECKNFRRGD